MHADHTQSLFEAISDSAALIDKSGRILDWNQGATALFNYHKKEVLGKSINLIYQQHYPFPKIIQETQEQHKKWIADTQFVRKNGIKGICKTFVSSITSSVDTKAAALIIHQNISEHKILETELNSTILKLTQQLHTHSELSYLNHTLLLKNLFSLEQMERAQRENELQFHLLAENATDIISRYSPDGCYLYASPACKTLLGYTPEELLGVSVYKLLHYDDINKLKKIFNRRKENIPHSIITYRIRRKEGDYRWFESNVRAIYDEKNKTIREIHAASRDITDRVLDKKARLRGQQLAHVSRLSSMEEMASGMAHEISQPLAAIINYTQGCVHYLQNNQQDPTQIIDIMKKAVAQAERAGQVIHRLKNFFCKGKLLKTSCKMNSLIRETVSLTRDNLNAAKTKIDFDFAKDIQIISADKIQIQQVLLNLIQNAIEAMQVVDSRQRRIRIQTKNIDIHSIEITIQDAGPGFSKEMIHKIFEPFYTTKAHGRGMGLAICRSIIEAHGGQFIVNPNTHGHSWIKFILPIN